MELLKHFNYMKIIFIHSSDTDGRALLGRFQTTSQNLEDDVEIKVHVRHISIPLCTKYCLLFLSDFFHFTIYIFKNCYIVLLFYRDYYAQLLLLCAIRESPTILLTLNLTAVRTLSFSLFCFLFSTLLLFSFSGRISYRVRTGIG